MKAIAILFTLFFLSSHSFAQKDYCDYFKIEIEKTEVNGKAATYISPRIVTLIQDKYAKFLERHKNRFDYLLFNRIDSITKFGLLYPDTLKIEQTFCDYLSNDDKFKNYLAILGNTNKQKLVFSKQELFKIASRFFLCDKINFTDTSIGYHICIGINGQKEFKSEKDFTTLEAFCFEAIFFYLNQDNEIKFKENFEYYIQKASQENLNDFKDFNSHLENVKQSCYRLMEKDLELRRKLVKYYQKNKKNIGIVIK